MNYRSWLRTPLPMFLTSVPILLCCLLYIRKCKTQKDFVESLRTIMTDNRSLDPADMRANCRISIYYSGDLAVDEMSGRYEKRIKVVDSGILDWISGRLGRDFVDSPVVIEVRCPINSELLQMIQAGRYVKEIWISKYDFERSDITFQESKLNMFRVMGG